MTTIVNTAPSLASRFVNGILSIKPLANLAKQQARSMMIKRAETIGVPWTKRVQELREAFVLPQVEAKRSPLDKLWGWDEQLSQVQNPQLSYPDYYLRSFHAYDNGNLNWEAAFEVEVAAFAVHAKIWPDAGSQGDARLRQSYHDVLQSQLSQAPQDILDLGCSVGLSTFELQKVYPQATITGVDLSPYFLAVAQYRSQQHQSQLSDTIKAQPLSTSQKPIHWLHAPAESTGLPSASFDLVSSFLMFHELPQVATRQIFREARRLLRPGGYLTLMDMNPQSEIFAKMPPYILTLLKSTEPYLDEYFALALEHELVEAGFYPPTVIQNSPRHRTVVAKVR